MGVKAPNGCARGQRHAAYARHSADEKRRPSWPHDPCRHSTGVAAPYRRRQRLAVQASKERWRSLGLGSTRAVGQGGDVEATGWIEFPRHSCGTASERKFWPDPDRVIPPHG